MLSSLEITVIVLLLVEGQEEEGTSKYRCKRGKNKYSGIMTAKPKEEQPEKLESWNRSHFEHSLYQYMDELYIAVALINIR